METDPVPNTSQFDWQNVVAQLTEYGCSDVSTKLSWSSDGNITIPGLFYEIYMGKLAGYDGSVAVKYPTNQGIGPLINEVRMVSRLKGPNVIPFLGFVLTEPREEEGHDNAKQPLDIGVVSPWVDFSLHRWMRTKEDMNRCQLAIQVVEAVIYLHDVGVIHGDLRCRSIMVSNKGMIQITGFGSSVLEQDTPDQERSFQYAPRWAAPERFYKESTWPTKKSDIWSLGMVILELLTNDIPYQGMSDLRAIAFIGDGRTPDQPSSLISIKPGFNRILWGLLLSCWQRNPDDRTSPNVVRDILSIVNREGTTAGEIKGNEPRHTVIEHTLPLPTIIERLVEHGCSDVRRQLTKLHNHPRWSGSMSDVYQAQLLDGTPVAVKCLREFRNSENQPDKVLKHTAQELYTWSISAHPNVLELIGLAVVQDRLAMVAPWVEYGSLLAYIKAKPTADRRDLCMQVADGLAYMHSLGIAHGDIKGDNVMVSEEGTAKITDFGCATMKREFPVAFTVTNSLHYSVRWAAPELFLDDGATSFETDVYALGMTILETLTGNVPYKDRADMAVIHVVLVRKLQPVRPLKHIPQNTKGDELWGLLERCWSYEPKDRPKASDVRDSEYTFPSSQMELEKAIHELTKCRCPDLTEKVTFVGETDDIAVIGGFYDIFKASLVGYEGVVAVKYSGNAVLEDIFNELRIVSKLEHPNILPCLGYIVTPLRGLSAYDRVSTNQRIIGIVYPWVDLNLRDYLKLRSNANRAYLCNQIIEGLLYLHDTGVIHGDLRSRNVMISKQGTVQITGFGGSVLSDDPPGYGNDFQMAGRWAAPERMLSFGAEPTIKADIWSLGMTILETFTGDVPYPKLSELKALVAVADGKIPTQPDKFINLKTGYGEILWALLLVCFQLVPGNRPSLMSVRDILTVIQREGQIDIEANEIEHIVIKRTMTLPTIIERLVDQGCLDVTKQLTYMEDGQKYSGALSDVYQARLFNGKLVAVKCLRALTNSESKPEKVFKRTARELYAWSVSTHPNVLELVGLAVFRDKLAMVAPWMPYGSLLAYISANPECDRCNLCTQVAEGLVYIHGLGIAHGDIKGDNVVVSNEGVAKITDFGCATMRRDFPVAFTATQSVGYSVRWAAPELFLDEGIRTNYETDVYALGMTILEALTGTVPHKDKADLAVIHTVVFRREHPTRPIDCIPPQSAKGDALWKMLERCWSHEPHLRPKAIEVRNYLSSMTQGELTI
ncbi:kinase-like domain-containing protein [Rhizoctonia solani]|nr:kinase-like domain-containing protein [Rhizoctonia solani]